MNNIGDVAPILTPCIPCPLIQEFQQVLTDFQGCEEEQVSQAQDAMRKHVVFESSTLANQQYDLQMLFKVWVLC